MAEKKMNSAYQFMVGSINCFQSILFLFRADFRAEGGSSVSQSERKRCLYLLSSQRNVSEANAVHCNRLTIGKMPK